MCEFILTSRDQLIRTSGPVVPRDPHTRNRCRAETGPSDVLVLLLRGSLAGSRPQKLRGASDGRGRTVRFGPRRTWWGWRVRVCGVCSSASLCGPGRAPLCSATRTGDPTSSWCWRMTWTSWSGGWSVDPHPPPRYDVLFIDHDRLEPILVSIQWLSTILFGLID